MGVVANGFLEHSSYGWSVLPCLLACPHLQSLFGLSINLFCSVFQFTLICFLIWFCLSYNSFFLLFQFGFVSLHLASVYPIRFGPYFISLWSSLQLALVLPSICFGLSFNSLQPILQFPLTFPPIPFGVSFNSI